PPRHTLVPYTTLFRSSRYANATSRVQTPSANSKPRNPPPGQCSSREPNCTTKSSSATTNDSTQRPGCRSRPAAVKNCLVPSMPRSEEHTSELQSPYDL